MTLPTKPAGYWRPHADLSTVYYLTRNHTWRVWGKDIDESEVPEDLVFLGHYLDTNPEKR